MLEEEKKDVPTEENKTEQVETEKPQVESNENVEEPKKEELTMTQTIAMNQAMCPVEIVKEDEGCDFINKIETSRSALNEAYKKNRKLSTLVTIVSVGAIIACFVLISQKNNKACQIAGFSIAGVLLVALILYLVLARNKFPNMTKKYVSDVMIDINKHVFNSPDFTEVFYQKGAKEDKVEITCDRVYLNITDVNSRNIVKGLYRGNGFKVSEMAAYSPLDKRKRNLAFLGKFISATNDLHFDGRIIVSKQNNEKPTDIPTDIEDLLKETLENGLTIYYSETAKDYTKILGKKFLELVNTLTLDEILLNFNIVIWPGRTAAYVSYDDALIAIPFDKPFSDKPLNKFMGDFKIILDAFEMLKDK